MHRTPVMDERSDSRCDLIYFSTVRWDDQPQRAQQLATRAALDRRVFFVEAPVVADGPPHLAMRRIHDNVIAITPSVPHGTPDAALTAVLRGLVDHLIGHQHLTRYVLWFDAPGPLAYAHHLEPVAVVYDAADSDDGDGDDATLLGAADVVFTAEPGTDGWSWDRTWRDMDRRIEDAISARSFDDDDGLGRYASARPAAVLSAHAY